MSFATSSRFTLSSIARLSAVHAMLLILAFAAMAAAVIATTNHMTTYELRGPLLQEAAFVREVIETEGLAHAIDEINLRTAHSTLILHRLEDAQGGLLAGEAWLPRLATGWTFIDPAAARGAQMQRIIAHTSDVAEGVRLTVAIEMSWANSVRNVTLGILAAVGAGVITLALAIGAFWTNFTHRRMHGLWTALRAAGSGDFRARAPVREARAPDDIDALARRFNEMMDHTDLLVANVRRVSTNVAHDLRRPLTHLSQRLDQAAMSRDLDAAHREIAGARSKVNDIFRLFDSMLHLAELETGRMRASFTILGLRPIVERVADAYRAQLEERGGVLTIDIDQDAEIIADEGLITRALSNLLENAEQHAPNGEEVTVSLKKTTEGVLLSVEDRGPGVPEADIARMLAPFERLDESRGKHGYGLGLSIVAAIAKIHDAQLRFENTPGLRATLAFPRANPPTT